MHRTMLLIITLVALTPALAQVQPRPEGVRRFDIFQGTTRVRMRDAQGAARLVDVDVSVQNWIVNERQKVDALPVQYKTLMVVQVNGGEITTVIQGEKQKRKENEFWTVPAGTAMGFETGNDSASIQTIAVSSRS